MSTVDKKTGKSPSSTKPGESGQSGPSSDRSSNRGLTLNTKLYLKGIRSEWTKIAWPTWPQIWGQTIIVLIMVILISLGLFLIDNGFHFMITWIVPRH